MAKEDIFPLTLRCFELKETLASTCVLQRDFQNQDQPGLISMTPDDWVHSPSACPVLSAWECMVSLAPLASEGSRARFILEWDSLGAKGGGSFVTMETDQVEVGKCAQNSQRARGVPGLCVTE